MGSVHGPARLGTSMCGASYCPLETEQQAREFIPTASQERTPGWLGRVDPGLDSASPFGLAESLGTVFHLCPRTTTPHIPQSPILPEISGIHGDTAADGILCCGHLKRAVRHRPAVPSPHAVFSSSGKRDGISHAGSSLEVLRKLHMSSVGCATCSPTSSVRGLPTVGPRPRVKGQRSFCDMDRSAHFLPTPLVQDQREDPQPTALGPNHQLHPAPSSH